jgi:cell volume regulation protein A
MGVLITALLMGWFSVTFLDFSLLEGFVLGAIISSTDAAAVFAVLRSRSVCLQGNLRPLLELESGSNDPMAVFLTTGFIMLVTQPGGNPWTLVPLAVWQMACGAAAGYFLGRGGVLLVNRLRLEYEGLYPVLTLTLVLLTYGITATVGGNGFLAVYVSGIVMGNGDFVHKKSLTRFHDGLAWLMQIAMFLILGLQVYPSRLVPIAGVGLAAAAFLMLVARPVSVFVSLAATGLSLREKVMVSWVGLRGAVPIILGTFPFLAGMAAADTIFHIVFFIVFTSALLQGASLPQAARWLGLEAPCPPGRRVRIDFEAMERGRGDLVEIEIPADSQAVGRQIVELGLPAGALVVLISRREDFVVPSGGTVLAQGDILHVLAPAEATDRVRELLTRTMSM